MKWRISFQEAMEQETLSLFRRCLLAPLSVLAPLYGAIQLCRAQAYTSNLLPRRTLPCKVISVGNLTLGGTGKTPFVALLARLLSSRGHRPIIVSRGYGGKAQGKIQLVSDGRSLFLHPPFAADEPYMLARKLPTIPVLCGKDRYRVAIYALKNFSADIVILDDGFQHLPLTRNVDILLVDSTVPLEHAQLFPRGVLREPLRAMTRADFIFLTKTASPPPPALIQLLRQQHPHAPLYQSYYSPQSLFQTNEQQCLPLEALRGVPVLAFCGIAHPSSFFALLKALGCELVGTYSFPDHYSYRAKELALMIRAAQDKGAVALVTTEKDGARLFPHLPLSFPLWELRIEAAVREAHWLETIERAL